MVGNQLYMFVKITITVRRRKMFQGGKESIHDLQTLKFTEDY